MNLPLICLLSTVLVSQTQPPEELDVRKATLDAFLKDAQGYEMTWHGEKSATLNLVPRSILNWGSAERNDENGSIFVWTREGRPEVIGAIWSLYRKNTKQTVWRHGLQSLSEQPIIANFQSKLIWSPRSPGVRFQPLEGAEAPANNPQRRLVQMRSLAREFSVEIDEPIGVTSQLRLLSQPIFRYEPSGDTNRDGAIFALNAGTDPDALLLLEARETDQQLQWEFAFGRLHFAEMRAVRHGQQAWKVDRDLENRHHRFGTDPGREKIYYSVVRPR